MNKGFSIYLDMVRALLAFIVLVHHATSPVTITGMRQLAGGPEAVVGFFVLSGFVIAMVADRAGTQPLPFVLSRLARLWSVLIPALLLTLICDAVGRSIDLAPYGDRNGALAFDAPLIRIFLAALFLNEAGLQSIPVLSNSPLWSVSYEFWYYMLFAAWTFLSGGKKWVVLAALLAITGPRIILLMPPWLMGVALYRWRGVIPHNPSIASLLALGGLGGIALGFMSGIKPILLAWTETALGVPILQSLRYSENFIWFSLLGVMVTVHLAGMFVLLNGFTKIPEQLARVVQWFAGRSFALYLMHHPIQLMLAAMTVSMVDIDTRLFIILAGSTGICLIIGGWVEPWRHPMRSALLRIASWPTRRSAAA